MVFDCTVGMYFNPNTNLCDIPAHEGCPLDEIETTTSAECTVHILDYYYHTAAVVLLYYT